MLKKIFIALPVILLVAVLGFVAWGSAALGPTPEAVVALQPDMRVTVETVQDWTVFRPASSQPRTGLIFYPGGKVDYRSYAPLLREIAAHGYQVVLVPMPINLAIFGINKAQAVIDAFPNIQTWAIAGHSLGGSMAAQFVLDHPGEISAIAFWASYPASSMANLPIPALSIVGSQDGLATQPKIDQSRALLPADARIVIIPGGNHAQFGAYGLQPGDGKATIPAEAQWEQAVKETVNLLDRFNSVSGGPR